MSPACLAALADGLARCSALSELDLSGIHISTYFRIFLIFFMVRLRLCLELKWTGSRA